ncbi:FAD/NAD-P-binding domain-containing protein [Mycena vitilis]|nr:FAD/NAD-P-binding domain-containing protein [Mycena vitilis]
MTLDPRSASVVIVGSGAAGLITAYTLLQDGFSDVQILTQDSTAGGVWAAERVYPGLQINNVHGEYRFAALEMPRHANAGGRLMGHDLRAYMEAFSQTFLKPLIRFDTKVIHIRRDENASIWFLTVEDKKTSSRETLEFSRVVLCTGGCSAPKIPRTLSPDAAKRAGFRGPVIHSKYFAANLALILENVPQISPGHESAATSIVVVGGGKSAQERVSSNLQNMSAYLANEGRSVTIVFETADAFLASPRPLPEFIRKSRLLSIMSGHVALRSRLERFLHGTWLGSRITHCFWSALSWASLQALSIPKTSPLRNTHSLFWSTSVNDEGVPQQNRFHAFVNNGNISVIAPARVQDFGPDGNSVVLNNGETIKADILLLATGYASSWTDIFNRKKIQLVPSRIPSQLHVVVAADTAELLGIKRHSPRPQSEFESEERTHYSLANPPASCAESEQWASSIYNGIVPARNITRRDFAINGAVFSTNVGYTCEVVAHWISSYFLGDEMDIPKTPEEAYQHTERNAAWIRKRHPDALLRVNESYSSVIAFWTWPQYTDQLLEEMGLRSMRSGGNWFTWPFKVIDLKEISTLAKEREERRAHSSNSQ